MNLLDTFDRAALEDARPTSPYVNTEQAGQADGDSATWLTYPSIGGSSLKPALEGVLLQVQPQDASKGSSPESNRFLQSVEASRCGSLANFESLQLLTLLVALR